ncbi:gas vesicle protein GvpO [Plantactinospora sp. ZYX-F-223]|uniref:gas vesicle protein GvpO n=1 Tax=Plantactinospora sp. ZYX-F-223 TaxID=3144103 RepID=UPI0031FC2023
MAARTHRADRGREHDRYPDQDDDHREEDDRPDDDRYDDDADDEDRADDESDDKYDDESDHRTGDRRRPARRRTGPARVVSAQVAARNGARHIAGLTGKQVTGVTSLDRTERGWVVGVEVVEDARVPSSADILAVYRTELDTGGELAGYRRTRRYPRGRGDSGTGAA